MHERSSTAFRAAVLLTLAVAACNDAPLAPRGRTPQPKSEASLRQGNTQTFSGRQADSVMRVFDVAWARSHPEYQNARRAWRKANGIPDSAGDPRLTPIPITPNALLAGDESGTYRSPPKIISHYEALHFGQVDKSSNVPDGIEAEAVFVGDQAEISVQSVTITGKDGSTYSSSGEMAQGPGQLINCTDAVLGTCDNRRRLNGVMALNGAPTCSASGSATVGYYVSNVNLPVSIGLGPVSTGSSGNNESSVAANAQVTSQASPCSSGDDGGQQPTDSTNATPPTGPVGVPSGPPPPPTGPNAPYYPPVSYPPTTGGTGTVSFHCEQGDIYYYGALFETRITCYPDP
ncbi:MAG TPA: hypothetical protein VGH98_20725 [Gemmatimonadaceae bacterium]|jgi:hypothetical protein